TPRCCCTPSSRRCGGRSWTRGWWPTTVGTSARWRWTRGRAGDPDLFTPKTTPVLPARTRKLAGDRRLVGTIVGLALNRPGAAGRRPREVGAATRYLEARVPDWADGTPFSRIADSIEFPVYAIALGLLGNVVLTRLAVREALAGGFRTEFFIKTGLMLLGASVKLQVLVTAAGPAIVQALLLNSIVSGFTGWLCGRCGLATQLRP